MTQEKSQWISVKDRLPDKDGTFLTVIIGFKVHKTINYRLSNFENGEWWDEKYEDNLNTHYWMPLPAPPEGIEE